MKLKYHFYFSDDRTRVKLSPVDDEEGSDYINSNYIPVRYTPRAILLFHCFVLLHPVQFRN